MEDWLAKEVAPPMTDAEIDQKLAKEKKARWKKIEILYTMRDSAFLNGQSNEIAFGLGSN